MNLFLKQKNRLPIFFLVFLLAWLGFFLLQKIDLTTADLGRHLKNGEVILGGNFGVLKTNFYSYTHPDFPFINHHWLTGIIFYLVFKIGGFWSLHLFSIILILITFFIFFRLAEKESNTKIAAILSLILIPLIAYRQEIRPEIFSYLFAAIFFWILWHYRKGTLSRRFLFVLPFLEILWINIHIYFLLGLLIIGSFLFEKIVLFLKTKKESSIKILSFTFISSLAAALLNPFGLKGVLHPFRIYKNYGYRILEEQSVWFLEKVHISNPNFLLFKTIIVLLILSFILVLIKNRQRLPLVNFFLAAGFSIVAYLATRNLTLFGFFALPIIAINLKNSFPKKIKIKSQFTKAITVILALIIFITILFTHHRYLSFQWKGIGLLPENSRAAKFLKQEKIQGPILNNYDIGGYLIYYLFPENRVFVDNRPEAYPASFFKEIYIPLQENNDIWQEQDKIYNFNVIFFSPRDYTPWGQNFLIERIQDSQWAPVFVDNYAIIFLKRNMFNQPIIEKYEIPKEYFRIIKS